VHIVRNIALTGDNETLYSAGVTIDPTYVVCTIEVSGDNETLYSASVTIDPTQSTP
jgi:hypothetical protein